MNNAQDSEENFWSWGLGLLVTELWKRKGNVIKWFRGNEESKKILILGPGGVGKTTLGEFLVGPSKLTAQTSNYDESIDVEHYKLNGSNAEIVVLPGQDHRMDATWTNVLEDVKAGQYRGVIFVFSYGFHTMGDISYKNHRAYCEGQEVSEFVEEYTKQNREVESEIFEKVCETLRTCEEPIWLLKLITKQDLWENEKDLVIKHYKDGKYVEAANLAIGGKDSSELRCETTYVSLTLRSMKTGRGELLKESVSGYDQAKQQVSVEKLLKVFEGLMQWEKANA